MFNSIQAEAIPFLDFHDVVGIAQTGTGKTAAFGLLLLALIDSDQRHVQALLLRLRANWHAICSRLILPVFEHVVPV